VYIYNYSKSNLFVIINKKVEDGDEK